MNNLNIQWRGPFRFYKHPTTLTPLDVSIWCFNGISGGLEMVDTVPDRTLYTISGIL
jgi:hypothetical protein